MSAALMAPWKSKGVHNETPISSLNRMCNYRMKIRPFITSFVWAKRSMLNDSHDTKILSSFVKPDLTRSRRMHVTRTRCRCPGEGRCVQDADGGGGVKTAGQRCAMGAEKTRGLEGEEVLRGCTSDSIWGMQACTMLVRVEVCGYKQRKVLVLS